MRLKLSPAAAVWLLTGAITALAAVLHVAFVAGTDPLNDPELTWWMIGLGVIVAEVCVVHLAFRRSAHSFSLADIPIVFGLVFAAGDQLVIGVLLGSLVVYAGRRIALIKLVFNLAQLWLVLCVAVAVVRGIAPDGGLGPRMWLALYVGTIVSGVLTITCIATAIAISEGGLRSGMLAQMFAMDGIVTVTNTSLAIGAAVAVSADPRVAPVLAIPPIIVFATNRAYIAERQRLEKLEFLYEANRTLSQSPEVAEALEGLLKRSLEAFNCEVAEVLLFQSDGSPLRTTLGPGEHRALMEPGDPEVARALAAMVDDGAPTVSITPPFQPAALRAHFEERAVRLAMVAILRGEDRPIGTLMLANRFARSFTGDDLRLLEALANNASVALQYDRLEQAVAKLEALQDQLHHQAYHDPLTDLPNRTLFMESVRNALVGPAEHVAVLFVDVDDFKTVNDSLGHATGDELLVAVGERLRHCLRPEDVVARLGGDEFAVLLPGGTDQLAAGRTIAERVMRAFDDPVRAGGDHLVNVHLSVGIATSAQAAGDADQLIRNADVAMYQAKAKGKGRFEVFEPSVADAILRRHGLKEELAKAVAREQIVVEYQPIIELETGRIAAAEALVRWEHPARGVILPSEFVPLAEETGLITGIGRHVLQHACRQARDWQDRDGGEPVRMHVNMSVVELLERGVVDRIVGTLDEAGVPPGHLVIEITETQLLADAPATAARFQELRGRGILIALDDFGTGYSSLSYLHSLPLDILKVAKPFVDGLVAGGRESGFVAMILDLAGTLGLEVIAEGIETPEQVAALRRLNTPFGQGYLLGRPSARPPAPVGAPITR